MDDDELGSPGHDDNPKTKEFPQTLPLSQHAIESLRDRLSKPQPLKLSGRPVTAPISPQHLKVLLFKFPTPAPIQINIPRKD